MLVRQFHEVVAADIASMRRSGLRSSRAQQSLQWLMDALRLCKEAMPLAPATAPELVLISLEVRGRGEGSSLSHSDPNLTSPFQILEEYCHLSMQLFSHSVCGLPRAEVTAHFEAVLKCISEIQACTSLVTDDQWRKILSQASSAAAPGAAKAGRNYQQQKHQYFSRYVQSNERLCSQLQECCSLLMAHVVKAAQPLFERMHEAGWVEVQRRGDHSLENCSLSPPNQEPRADAVAALHLQVCGQGARLHRPPAGLGRPGHAGHSGRSAAAGSCAANRWRRCWCC